jgi:hypothetical protein
VTPELDHWLPHPTIRVSHRRQSSASPDRLWEAARNVRLGETRLLGRLVRWRIPGLAPDLTFDELFRAPPFIVLAEEPGRLLVSGLVGRIWTLRRDYPELEDPDAFRRWDTSGTARVVFANWIEAPGDQHAAIHAEVRVEAIGAQGRVGVAAVRPLVRAFGSLIGSDGIDLAARRAERDPAAPDPADAHPAEPDPADTHSGEPDPSAPEPADAHPAEPDPAHRAP